MMIPPPFFYVMKSCGVGVGEKKKSRLSENRKYNTISHLLYTGFQFTQIKILLQRKNKKCNILRYFKRPKVFFFNDTTTIN